MTVQPTRVASRDHRHRAASDFPCQRLESTGPALDQAGVPSGVKVHSSPESLNLAAVHSAILEESRVQWLMKSRYEVNDVPERL